MRMKLKKAVRDLSINPKRTLLVVLALVLGIWGVGTVLVSYTVLTNDLDANYSSTKPLHAVFYSDDFTRSNLQRFIDKPEVETAEFRDFSLHRIEIEPDIWIPLWLFGVEDFEKFNLAQIFHEEGNRVPKSGSILVERDGRHLSDIHTGSTLRVNVEGKITPIPVDGICFDPAQAPATQDAFIYAYTDKQTYEQITGMPADKRLIVRFNNVHSFQDVEKAVRNFTDDLSKSGITVSSVDIPRFNEHPHQWQLNTLLFLIGAIGLLAFLMGAVLVSQLMQSIMAGQVRQIGILKAVGASCIQVFQIYAAMLLLIGALSGLIAIPLAIHSGNAFSAFVAAKLNFNILTTTVPFSVYLILVLASLLLPLILSVSILLRGTRISVKQALSDYGISLTGNNKFMALKKVSFSGSFLLAVRNLQRNFKRLAITILTMALGVAIFNTGFNVRQSLWELLSGLKNELKYDVQVAFEQPIPIEEAVPLFAGMDNVQSIEAWIGGRTEIQSNIISTDNGVGIVALPKNTNLLQLDISDGHWLQSSDKIEVVLNQQAWIYYQKPPTGSEIDLPIGGKHIKAIVAGIANQYEKPRLYMDIAQYNKLANSEKLVNTLVIAAKENSYPQVLALKKEVEKTLAPSGLNVLYVMSQAERVKIVYDHLNIILTTIVLLSFLVLVVSAIGMASATGINIMERTREIGVMRAIGATPKKIYALFVSEGMITAVLSIISGLLIAYPLSNIASAFFGRMMLGEEAKLQFAFSLSGFGITLLITLLFGWLASRIPAKSAVNISTRQALTYE